MSIKGKNTIEDMEIKLTRNPELRKSFIHWGKGTNSLS